MLVAWIRDVFVRLMCPVTPDQECYHLMPGSGIPEGRREAA